jgi:hypothetical protein
MPASPCRTQHIAYLVHFLSLNASAAAHIGTPAALAASAVYAAGIAEEYGSYYAPLAQVCLLCGSPG